MGSFAIVYDLGPVNDTELTPTDFVNIQTAVQNQYLLANNESNITADDILRVDITFEKENRRRDVGDLIVLIILGYNVTVDEVEEANEALGAFNIEIGIVTFRLPNPGRGVVVAIVTTTTTPAGNATTTAEAVTTTTVPFVPPTSDDDDDWTTGEIVGLVFGVLGSLGLCGGLVYYMRKSGCMTSKFTPSQGSSHPMQQVIRQYNPVHSTGSPRGDASGSPRESSSV